MSKAHAQRATRDARLLVTLGLYLLLLAPVAVLCIGAFSSRWFFPQLLPREWTLEPLRELLARPQTRLALWNSTWLAGLVTLLSLAIGYPAARVLGLRTFRGKGLVVALLLLPTVVPPTASGIGLNILFLQLRLGGTALGVALAHLVPVLPYVVFGLAAVFARYDEAFEHQARSLGAGPLRVFYAVTLPLIWPGLVVAALFAFLISWSQYLLTLLIGAGRVVTLPLLLFATVAGGNLTTTSAVTLVFVAPLLLLIGLASRYLTSNAGGTQV
jgi:putative spermidine/putrescine transport system permease protein